MYSMFRYIILIIIMYFFYHWMGHVLRRDKDEAMKRVWNLEIAGKREKGETEDDMERHGEERKPEYWAG